MNVWKIEYWSEGENKSPIEKWLNKLEKNQIKNVYKEIGFLKKLGNELKLPHSKALGGGLFELREKEFGYRIYCGFQGQYLIILLAAGDKTGQDRDIKIARERLFKIKNVSTVV
jgi:putative addiction module killer protein